MKSIAKIFSAELEGVQSKLIEVEVDLNVGLHSLNIVGLADKALNEAKERVNSAIKNSGFKPPNRDNRRITVNLAPADIRKTGSQYDLAIALGYLVATRQVKKFEARDKLFLGELALDGSLRAVTGSLSSAEMSAANGIKHLFLPEENSNEASVVATVRIVAVSNLCHAVDVLENKSSVKTRTPRRHVQKTRAATELSDIRGHNNAKRALVIAASGGHNLLLTGPPGTGKSMLAKSLAGILPELTIEESIEVSKIWSACGFKLSGIINARPFRAPHQTASLAAVVGGGRNPKPGEISLAHRGVLFLDELPEFPRNTLEALRGPMETGLTRVSRSKGSLVFPARFSLVAAMNPCPCGFRGDREKECVCGEQDISRYRKKMSGPLLDRIDIQVGVPRLPLETLASKEAKTQTSLDAKEQVAAARKIQRQRFKEKKIRAITNAELSSREIERTLNLSGDGVKFLKVIQKFTLSPRGYYRLLKTARTIADLESEEKIEAAHMAEAWSYRLSDHGET